MSLRDCFPSEFTPSTNQATLINEIESAFSSGYKFVICCAPTGSGKSLISKTLGNAAAECTEEFEESVNTYEIFKRDKYGEFSAEQNAPFGSFVLTITKSLQDQYKSLFKDLDILKGQSNYQCSYDENYTVSTAPCLHINTLKSQCWAKNSCPYYKQRNTVLTSKFAALNYDMFLALPAHVKSREYIICDEASELEDQLVKKFTCTLNFKNLRKNNIVVPPVPTNANRAALEKWLISFSDVIDTKINTLKNAINKKTKSNKQSESVALSYLLNVKNDIKVLINTWYDSEYIFERNAEGVVFTPFKVDKLATHIFSYGEKVLLMSATIIDPENFAKSLGITKFKYIESPSSFDPQKAPIHIASNTKLNYYNLQANLPKIAKTIKSICDLHKNEKGIIHTQTNAITSYLSKNLNIDRIIYREPGVNNEEILAQHTQATTPTIIASPSMLYGVDLKDDLARFQIIIKAPYLPLGDKRIKQMPPVWYTNKMLAALIQACGRGIRSKKDHCITYILDYSIADAVITNKHKLPKYFVERFV
jgi:ATP-dependent DNA helicase DinG